MKKARRLLATTVLLFISILSAARGQTVLDGFDPNADGEVNAVVAQPDGKVLAGGNFLSLSPNGGQLVPRNFIARLEPDGAVDTAFNPIANNQVFSIALQADGKILAGGWFVSIGGQQRNFIARLDPITGLADSFNPSANSPVYAIAVQEDGKILVGGIFEGIGGQTRNHIARLDATTGLADSFNPNPDGAAILSIAVQADGKVLVGGSFTSIGGQPRNSIARLNTDGTLDTAFNPNANNLVQSIVVQADGQILAGGNFHSIGGQPRNGIARLDATTGLADSFNPKADGGIVSIAVQADGKVLVGGGFTSIGGQDRNNIARLDPITGLADSFNPNANSAVKSVAIQADGKILGGGFFTAFSPNGGGLVTRKHIARIESEAPKPTPPATINISGTVTYCLSTGPVLGVTMTRTGSSSGTTTTDALGNYTFSSLASGGNHTVTPSKAALSPGFGGIDTLDVMATQRHFLGIAFFPPSCFLVAADVNGDSRIDTSDVVAIQRFFVGRPFGTANVGKYLFAPASRTYLGLVNDRTGQNYDTLLFGDVASPFVQP